MLLNKLREYILPTDLEIHIYKNGIYVVNYTIISSFSDKKIVITKEDGNVTILGNNLIISKLEKDELFIYGLIDEVHLRWYMKNVFFDKLNSIVVVNIKCKNKERLLNKIYSLNIDVLSLEVINYKEVNVEIYECDLPKIRKISILNKVTILNYKGLKRVKKKFHFYKYYIILRRGMKNGRNKNIN